jgi:hypothetical protein
LACNQLIRLTPGEDEAVRANPRRFAIVPGHEIPEVEDVVGQLEHYAVIEKRAESSEVAERTDPRRPLAEEECLWRRSARPREPVPPPRRW